MYTLCLVSIIHTKHNTYFSLLSNHFRYSICNLVKNCIFIFAGCFFNEMKHESGKNYSESIWRKTPADYCFFRRQTNT